MEGSVQFIIHLLEGVTAKYFKLQCAICQALKTLYLAHWHLVMLTARSELILPPDMLHNGPLKLYLFTRTPLEIRYF